MKKDNEKMKNIRISKGWFGEIKANNFKQFRKIIHYLRKNSDELSKSTKGLVICTSEIVLESDRYERIDVKINPYGVNLTTGEYFCYCWMWDKNLKRHIYLCFTINFRDLFKIKEKEE